MSTTFILGAGFSAAEQFPLVSGLKDLVINFINGEQHPSYAPALAPGRGFANGEFFEGLRLADPCNTLGFEELLVELRGALRSARPEDPRHKTEFALKSGCARLLWGRHKSISKISSCYISFAQRFFKSSEMRANAVISFNWDVLLETALQDASVPWQYRQGSGTIPVLKPHGSINWSSHLQANGNCEYQGWAPIARNSNICYDIYNPLRDPDAQEINPSFRFMLFPGDSELPEGNRDLGLIWSAAEKAIAERDKVVFIGYSLPEYDSYSKQFFRRLVVSKDVEVYNPSGEHLRRFGAVFGNDARLFNQTFEQSPYGQVS